MYRMIQQNSTIIPRSGHSVSRKWISPNALRVLYRLKETGYYAYLVGGGVRDLLLGHEPNDFDVVTDAKPGEVKKIFRNCRLIGRRFRLAHIYFQNEIIEVATFRSNGFADSKLESKFDQQGQTQASSSQESHCTSVGQEPAALEVCSEQGTARSAQPPILKTEDGILFRDNAFGTPEEDANRRDFTVNALFYNIADFTIIDYVGGMNDLRSGLIRIIGDPFIRFSEDPIRMVRAVRFAATLGFDIEEKTFHAMLKLKDKLSLTSPARMYEEVLKLFLLGEAEKTYQLLRKTGMFSLIFPGLGAWVDTEADSLPRIWIGKALDWIDNMMQTERRVTPELFFALLFGQYIDEKIERQVKQGHAALAAITGSVREALLENSKRLTIPKRIGLTMRDIYLNQRRFEKIEGKHPQYFWQHPGFDEAYNYFCFVSSITEEDKDLSLWWKEFVKSRPSKRHIQRTRKKGRKFAGKDKHKKALR